MTLSPHCLRDYAAGKEETEAFTDEGRVRKAASFMMAGDFVKTWVKIKDPRTGNAPMLKDCVMVVLPNDLKQLHESVPQTETQEIFDSSVDAEAFIRDSNNPKGEREKRAMQLVIEKLGGQEAPHGKKNLVYTRYGKWQSEFPEFNNADTVWKKGGFRSVHANSYVRTKKQ